MIQSFATTEGIQLLTGLIDCMLGWWSGYSISEGLTAAFDYVTLGCDAFFLVQANVIRICGSQYYFKYGSQDGFSSGELIFSYAHTNRAILGAFFGGHISRRTPQFSTNLLDKILF